MTKKLDGVVLMVSAAMPTELLGSDRNGDLVALVSALLVSLTRHGGSMVFGGHPSVTPIVADLITNRKVDGASVHLHMPMFFFKNADNQDTLDPKVFPSATPHGTGAAPNSEGWNHDLQTMREAMARQSNAALFFGGKTDDFIGTEPGLELEWQTFRALQPGKPCFVSGLLDGYARSGLLPQITGEDAVDDYTQLPERRRERLLHALDVDEVVSIVLAQLAVVRSYIAGQPE